MILTSPDWTSLDCAKSRIKTNNNITIEKVSADPDDEDNKNYDVLDQFSMENKDKETMKKAIESFLKNGGDPGSIPY